MFNFFAGYGHRYRSAVVRWMYDLHSDPQVIIVPLTNDLLGKAIILYSNRPDKKWGLTDCISFEIMSHFDIQEALAFDEHFSQAGYTTLLR